MRFVVISLLFVVSITGCGDYAKKSAFNAYVQRTDQRLHTAEFEIGVNVVDIGLNKDQIIINKNSITDNAEDILNNIENIKDNMLAVYDIMPPSFILYVSTHNFEVTYGTEGVRIIKYID